MATRMLQRRGTASQWTSANTVLAAGEFGVETDTGQFKIGDGTTGWNSLPYFKDTIDLNIDLKAPLASPTFTGNVTLPSTTSIGDVSGTELALINGLTATASELNVLDGITASTSELNILDGVTADASEINRLDGLLASTAELNTLVGITASAAELNILDGATLSTAELNILDGVTSTTAELNVLDGMTSTTAELNLLSGTSATAVEIDYLSGVESAIQDQLDAKLSLSGGTMTGKITLDGNPTQALHASTKEYVDNVASGILAKPAVYAATTANLAATYSNGTDGVGATLTATSNGAFPLVDGVQLTTSNGTRGILVKNQSNAEENGRYNLTTLGDGSNPWVLTRCGLCDEPDEIPGMYVFVTDGDINEGTGWVGYVADPTTFEVGTDSISFFQFAGSGSVTAGTNIEVDGNQVSVVDDPEFTDITVTGNVDFTGATVIGIDALPDQTGNNGKYLTTDGTDASWATLNASPAMDDLSDVTVTSATANDVVYYNGTGWVNKYVASIPTLTNAQSGTTYTLVLGDAGKIVEVGNASAITVTVPTNAGVAYPIGTQITLLQTGLGQITVSGPSGGTLNATPGTKLRAQWSSATLLKRATDTWVLIGDLTA
jgi:hypothetical protein